MKEGLLKLNRNRCRGRECHTLMIVRTLHMVGLSLFALMSLTNLLAVGGREIEVEEKLVKLNRFTKIECITIPCSNDSQNITDG